MRRAPRAPARALRDKRASRKRGSSLLVSRTRRTLGRPKSRGAGFPFQPDPAAQRAAPAYLSVVPLSSLESRALTGVVLFGGACARWRGWMLCRAGSAGPTPRLPRGEAGRGACPPPVSAFAGVLLIPLPGFEPAATVSPLRRGSPRRIQYLGSRRRSSSVSNHGDSQTIPTMVYDPSGCPIRHQTRRQDMRQNRCRRRRLNAPLE